MSGLGTPAPPLAGEPWTPPPRWRSWDILRAALLVAAVYVVLKLLWVAHPVFFLAFLGVLFGLVLSAGADSLARWRVPRELAVLGLVLGCFGALGGIGAALAPVLRVQVEQLRTRLPDAVQQIENWATEKESGLLRLFSRRPAASQPAPSGGPVPVPVPGRPVPAPAAPQALPQRPAGVVVAPSSPGAGGTPITIHERLMQGLSGIGHYVSGFVTSTLAVVGSVLLIVFVAVYIAIDPRLYARGVLLLFPRRVRPRARQVLGAMAVTLCRWFVTQLEAMLTIGAVTTIALALLGVQAALALGLLAGLLEFIPIAGPILSAVPAIAMGFLDSPQTALYVLLAYIAIHQVEANVVVPLLVKQGLDLPPALTILTQSLMALVFGFLGLLVAVPLLATAMVAIKLLYLSDVLGEDVSLPVQAPAERVPATT